jgi:hypothetical protein
LLFLNISIYYMVGYIMSEIPYLAGRPLDRPEPLSRFLPPIPEGVITAWLLSNLPTGAETSQAVLVLDPFGASPRVAIEAARAGYTILVAANNPITRFMLEIAAHPPSEDDLRSALADLAASKKGDERLEPHIRSLYKTNCDQCGREVEVEAFLWDRGDLGGAAEKATPVNPTPYARIYHCPYCNASGEYPTTEIDLARAAQFTTSSLHRARALERVTSLDDPERHHAEEALAVYLPRAVYALFTVINRLDGLSLAPLRRAHLQALLLSACDQANTLWAHPTGRARPRALTIPPKFRENNVWLALEQAIQQWALPGKPVPLVIWPEQPPPQGGIVVFEGRLRQLMEYLADIPIGAVASALPRPNQAFWTLSALWAGWLWGREAAAPFKSVLRRRRYDWAWHTSALHAALESLATRLKPKTPFFALMGEAEPGFLSAAMIAADNAGYKLLGMAMPTEGGQVQISWQRPDAEASQSFTEDARVDIVRSAAGSYLRERGEPSHYLCLHAAALSALSRVGALCVPQQAPADAIAHVNRTLEGALAYRSGFSRLGGSEKSLDIGHWWLREVPEDILPLSDQVEIELVRNLINHPDVSLSEIYNHLYLLFPGLHTPNAELIQTCLESYGEETAPGSGKWHIQPQNMPKARRIDLKNITEQILDIGRALGYQVEGDQPIIWKDEAGEVVYAWYITVSAVISEMVFESSHPPSKSMIALPGGRSNLVAFKLQHDPRLHQAVDEGWRFVKFRQVRWLAQNPVLDREALGPLLAQDTLTYELPQMRLF